MSKVSVIGSGSWGVALATYMARHGNEVKIWSFSQGECDELNNKRKTKFLPDLVIPEGVTGSTSFEEVLEGTELIYHVTPSKFVRETMEKYKHLVRPDQMIIMCSKGFEPGTNKGLDIVIEEECPGIRYGILSGPSHAEEVSIEIPTLLVCASSSDELKDKVIETMASPTLRIYTTNDIKGVEIGGALKNIIAFCAGIVVGLNLGDNTFAALATRGLVEIARLGVKLGAEEKTFYGLSGLGDLIVTCSSEHSRNRRAGRFIGQGHTVEETRVLVGQTIESIDNIESAYKLAKELGVEMPIVNVVYDILYNGLDPKEAVDILMTRKLREE
ncbi:MAG: NAD(P)-dependent glycerol-3-phosphate dehydrogenase [Clostridia bacterium]|nr:NAD(P)-dependent glycerol-3-phosphate dehydrogenase [Clostridia bacterium]